jgi:opacity protein-like surface antigen
MMRESAYLLAILVAAVSSAAVAKDLKQDKKATAPGVAATQMSDAEMDKVTAGDAPNQGGPHSVSVGAAGLTQEVGGPFNARFGYNGYNNNNDYRGARFLLPP